MLVAVSILALSLSFLVYQRPPSTWLAFITRFTRSGASSIPEKSQHGETDHRTPAAEQRIELQTPTKHEDSRVSAKSPSPESTPKAAPASEKDAPAVPTFTLNEHESSDEDEEDNLPPPSFPAMNSAQRASKPPSLSAMPPPSTMPPPSKPSLMAPPPKPTTSLMPPPRVAASNLRALPNTSTQSMRVPTTGPLPNRGPVPNRGPPTSNGSLGLPPTAGASLKTSNARGKVLLSPGHSPLDWAYLQKSGKNLSGVDSMIRVTPAMLKEKNGRKGKPAWSIYQGKVYNISPYLPFHPGGEGELKRAAGKDGTKLFMEVHPWVNWENMLGECMVGIMVSEEQAPSDAGGLEDMD
ncbi:hypothetical protein J4E80_005610 [Alternaria sp. BMP 0032]|nr:hypothetical protein J4E80_005610 [Alternaria sp. BMP 0032]